MHIIERVNTWLNQSREPIGRESTWAEMRTLLTSPDEKGLCYPDDYPVESLRGQSRRRIARP